MAAPDPARDAAQAILSNSGFSVRVAASPEQAREMLADRLPGLVLVDSLLPGGLGLPFFCEVRDDVNIEARLLVSEPSVEEAAKSLGLGVSECLARPLREPDVRDALAFLRKRILIQGTAGLLKLGLAGRSRFGAMVGTSHAMLRVYELISRAAQTDATVLLTGESGTGKELVARTLHELSPRAAQPFLAFNCGAVLPGMIDSELFGHAKGSFTGADRVHAGIFTRASGGTLLLDEIADMPVELQVKLLRALEARSVMPVGGDRELPVNVRIIAATNRRPEDAVLENKLREDLYYRLRVIRIHLPPLRERQGDVRLLVADVLDELNREARSAKTIAPAAVSLLESQPWWGNVRELRNTMQEAFILSDRCIEAETLATLIVEWPRTPDPPPAPDPAAGRVDAAPDGSSAASEVRIIPGRSTLADAERQLILATLAQCGGNRARTARILGIDPKTLYTRLLSIRFEDGKELPP